MCLIRPCSKRVSHLCHRREAYRVLNPDGYFSIVAPNFNMLGHVFYAYEYQHSFVTNKGRLEGVLRDSGVDLYLSRTFLTELGFARWRWVDRIIAYIFMPIVTNRLFCGLIRGVRQKLMLFRIHKNFCDHIGVLGKKPL